MEALLRDCRHTLRHLVRTPGFALVTILTLALGIGANTAIFSVVNAVLLRPLGYPDSEQLVYISSQFPTLGFDQFWLDSPEFFEFRERTQTFASVGAFASGNVNLSSGDQPQRVASARVSSSLFDTLGVRPALGRGFTEAETLPNAARVAVISSELWQSAFGGRADVVGSLVEIDGVKRTIVGVMPRGFDVADNHILVWLPLGIDPANRAQNSGGHFLYLVGRLADGRTLASAKGELEMLLANWQHASGGTGAPGDLRSPVHTPNATTHRLRYDPLQAQVVGGARTAIWLLQGAVIFVLLIACANLANLLLARAESRHREFAIRTALGAGRLTLLRQFLVEGCVLSTSGAALGVGVAVFGVRALIAAYPASLPRSGDVALDAPVLAFTLVVALLTGAMFGLAPLLHLAPGATATVLKEGGQRSTGGRNRLRRALVVAEVAMAVALVIGAGLLLRTVMNLSAVDAGFNRSHLVTFGVSLPRSTYGRQEQTHAFYDGLGARLSAMPGVQSVAGVQGLPPVRQVNANDTFLEGVKPPEGLPMPNIDYWQNTTAGYVDTMGIPVVEGRAFLPSDADGPFVVLINQALARTWYPGVDPIGRRVRAGGPTTPWFTIVGILKDVKQGGLDRKAGTELYFDVDQVWRVPFAMPNALNFVVRTTLPPSALSVPVRQAVSALDASLPIINLRAMDDVFDEAIGRPRLLANLLGVFASLALMLAAIGSYGVLSYMVTERRREIGIRMALGADRGSVLRMVLSQGLRLTVTGVVLGVALVFAGNRVMTSLLFGVAPWDPATIGGVIGLMAAVALVACYLPAHGATRVDPMIVLRDE
jgi:predicted permease